VEAGPGEGDLALQLAQALACEWPQLAARAELVLVEPNPGMAARQRACLAASPLPCRWLSFEQLAQQPVCGVLIAHEVLDALAVERIVWDGALWRRQRVVLDEGTAAEPSLRLEPGEALEPEMAAQLEPLGLMPPGAQRPPGWCTELHPGLASWMQQAAAGIRAGALLVIDYAHEAWRYYAPQRSNGTLMAYRRQEASTDPLLEPGYWDLTAHLCIESVLAAARPQDWHALGQRRQGEALLALGLAQRLHGLQQHAGVPLDALLSRREALLRLVDPHTLGDFRWLAFQRHGAAPLPPPLFLQDPPLA
jgi:SAM-dependent MidA family methyltransferase